MSVNNNSFMKNTITLVFGTVLNKGVQFLVIPLFTRWLSTSEYGQFDLLYSYVLLLVPVVTLSTHEAVFRYGVEETGENRKSTMSGGFLLNFFNLIVVLIISTPLLTKWGTAVYCSFIFYLSAELFATYLRGYLRAIKRLNIYSAAMVISTVAMTISVTVLVYFLELGMIGMLLGYAIGTLIGNTIICIWTKWWSMLLFKRSSVNKIINLVKYSLPLVPNDMSWWVMNASDRQIINVFFGDAANGIYAIAHKVPALCAVVFNMFSLSWQQEVVEKIQTPERNEYFNSVINKMLNLLLTFCACLLAGSWILYDFVFDAEYYEAGLYSPILIVSAAIIPLSQFLGGIQIALKKPKQNGVTTICGAGANIVLHLLFVNWIGLFAGAVSTVFANLLIFLFRVYLLREYYRIRIDNKTKVVAWIFSYFFVMSYVHHIMILNLINTCLAAVAFLVINKDTLLTIMVRKRGR